ncbi:hypothetical protein TRFO_34789 [Tritrichomonas foetus]|uniref:Uncharacterized protein n=1 Tax=Tritrichomonas foetus TaxID=1144522 RepID=A0A1J4JMX0_9EUKA|nr:hypothetical protein TRFO_34789 [Tritrichomonas foetus]|eukprot:OHS98883.1 hypothetical protein TRFO_34789 [Tritrichomonas foetus]
MRKSLDKISKEMNSTYSYGYSTPSYGNAPYSTPKSSDYYSTSTPTAVNRLSYTGSSDYYYYYSTPSLYSKEDQVNIVRRKEKLKSDIAQLRQRYKQLKLEAQKIKKEKVPEGEITFIQAETKDESSKNNSIQIQNLLSDLFEHVQSAAAARAFVSVFEQQLKNEEKQRKYFCDESNAIASLFDFTEYKMECPSIRCLEQKLQPSLREDYRLEERRLNKMNNELVSLACPTSLSSIQIEAATNVVKLTDLQCKLSTVGLHILRADVNHLQKASEEQEMNIKKKSTEVEYIRRKFKAIEIENQQSESAQNAQLLANESTYQQQFECLDREIAELQKKIDESAFHFDELEKSIKKLNEEKIVVASSQNSTAQTEESIIADEIFNDDEYEYEEEEIDENEEELKNWNQMNQIKENQLTADKIKLQNEINRLKKQYEDTKKKLRNDEFQLKEKIKRLYTKYSTCKKKIKEQYLIACSSSSNVENDIADVLKHIDSSINQLKSGFEL